MNIGGVVNAYARLLTCRLFVFVFSSIFVIIHKRNSINFESQHHKLHGMASKYVMAIVLFCNFAIWLSAYEIAYAWYFKMKNRKSNLLAHLMYDLYSARTENYNFGWLAFISHKLLQILHSNNAYIPSKYFVIWNSLYMKLGWVLAFFLVVTRLALKEFSNCICSLVESICFHFIGDCDLLVNLSQKRLRWCLHKYSQWYIAEP